MMVNYLNSTTLLVTAAENPDSTISYLPGNALVQNKNNINQRTVRGHGSQ